MKRKDYSQYFDKDGWLKPEYLWPLRQQITLGSMYVADYENDFGISRDKVCDFFLSFWDSYTEELAQEQSLMDKAKANVAEMRKTNPKITDSNVSSYIGDEYLRLNVEAFDNEDTLLGWYGCFDEICPLAPTIINVDIHYDFARSIQVIAPDENEAYDIVDEMMNKGEIPLSSFEPTGDWELDTTYQPE